MGSTASSVPAAVSRLVVFKEALALLVQAESYIAFRAHNCAKRVGAWHTISASKSLARHKWKVPNPVSSNVILGLPWRDLPLLHRRRRQTGWPYFGALPAEIRLSDRLAMKVLSLSGRSFN